LLIPQFRYSAIPYSAFYKLPLNNVLCNSVDSSTSNKGSGVIMLHKDVDCSTANTTNNALLMRCYPLVLIAMKIIRSLYSKMWLILLIIGQMVPQIVGPTIVMTWH